MSAAAALPHDLGLNGRMRATLTHIGREREPVLVIEDVMRDARNLVDYAAREVAFRPAYGPDGGYPGLRGPAPLDYVETLVRALQPAVIDAFGLEGVKLRRAECNFSLVTLAPGELAPAQRVPHVDTVDPLQFAFLHYLCNARFGGTAFYRHRATGFEALTAERLVEFETVRANEESMVARPRGYPAEDDPHFEQTAAFEASFDRLLVYRSRVLHSGRIAAVDALSADPRRGRLTANVFLSFRSVMTG